MKTTTKSMLTGADLLAKVKELGDCAKTDLAKGCGYTSPKRTARAGEVHPVLRGTLEAKGLTFSTGGSGGVGKGGRKLSYKAVVQGNGNLLIGKAYTAMLDLNPGDEFDIKLGKKAIRLVPVGGAEDEE